MVPNRALPMVESAIDNDGRLGRKSFFKAVYKINKVAISQLWLIEFLIVETS